MATKEEKMTNEQINEVIALVAVSGYDVDAETVAEFQRVGSGPESTVGPEYDEARDDALQEALDEIGVGVGR